MNSNENDAMERNDLLSEVNILICYMHESELRMQSYGAMNRGTWTENSEDLDEFDLGFVPDLDRHANRGAPVRQRRLRRARKGGGGAWVAATQWVGAAAAALCHVAAPDRRGRATAALSGDSRTCPGARGEN